MGLCFSNKSSPPQQSRPSKQQPAPPIVQVEKKSDPLKASGTIVRVSSVSSRYSLSFADPYQLEDVTVVDLSDGLAYNSLVRMGVQKMKKQQSADTQAVFLYRRSDSIQKYIDFGFLPVDCESIRTSEILNDSKTARVLFNFRTLLVFKDEEDVSKKSLGELLSCLARQGIKVKQVNLYPKSLAKFLERLNLSDLQRFFFPLQMFSSSDILEKTKVLRDESFNIYLYGSSYLAGLQAESAEDLFSRHLAVKTIVFLFELVEKSWLQSPLYRVAVLIIQKENKLSEQAIRQELVPLLQKVQSNNESVLLVHDSAWPSSSQLVREALELYLQVGLLIHREDTQKYLDQRKSGVVVQQLTQVKSQIKPKIRLKEGEERGDFTEKSRLEEMKELYQSLYKKLNQEQLVDGCHQTIYRLVQNIINNPEVPKFKQFYRTNKNIQMNILQYKEGVQLLKLSGFIQPPEDAEVFQNYFDIGTLKLARGDLELAYKQYKEV